MSNITLKLINNIFYVLCKYWHTVRAKQQLFGNNFNIPKYDSKIHIIHYFYFLFLLK